MPEIGVTFPGDHFTNIQCCTKGQNCKESSHALILVELNITKLQVMSVQLFLLLDLLVMLLTY